MSHYQPPLTLTPTMLALVAAIGEQGGRLSARHESALLDGKRVLGLPWAIQEVRNAFAAYEAMPGWSPASRSSKAAGSVQSTEEGSEETPLLALPGSNPALTARQAAERLGLSQRAVENQRARLNASSPLASYRSEQGRSLADDVVSSSFLWLCGRTIRSTRISMDSPFGWVVKLRTILSGADTQ